MATNTTRRGVAPGDAVRSSASLREAVDVALNRILCELALAVAPADRVVGQVAHEREDLVELVRDLTAPTLEPLLKSVAAAEDLAQLERALTTFCEAWTAWSVHGERRPQQAGGIPDHLHQAAAAATSASHARIDQVTRTSTAPTLDAGAARRVDEPMPLDPPPPPAAEVGPTVIRTRRGEDGVGQASVKVDTRKLDNLVDMVGELVIVQAMLQEDPALLRAADDRLTRNMAQLKRITSELQRTGMSMRMVPIRQTFQKMARLVRDLSRKSGKAVDLVLAGEETELDRRVVEDINDPLMHMVRNSVDHGIEDAAGRAQSGKRPEGRLSLSAYHQGGNIVIAIRDDGAGLRTDRILAKALSQGLVQSGETLTPPEIHQLIFSPGFSTAATTTEIPGRGVGMDVVRRNIEALQGRIEIQSTPGVGTTFLIKLPLTLAILDGLVLGVGRERFVMPTVSVRQSLRPTPEQVHTVKGRP